MVRKELYSERTQHCVVILFGVVIEDEIEVGRAEDGFS